MRHKWQSPIAAVVAVAIVGLLYAVGASPPQTRLPGAAAEIDAAEYQTIQAAIDALPEAGGIVRIPPGTFEIAEPLIIGKSDVTIEGCHRGRQSLRGPSSESSDCNGPARPGRSILRQYTRRRRARLQQIR